MGRRISFNTIILNALAAGTAAVLAACEAPPSWLKPSQHQVAEAPLDEGQNSQAVPASDLADVDEATRQLIEQAQRDVEELARLRAAAQQQSDTSAQDARQQRAESPAIEWTTLPSEPPVIPPAAPASPPVATGALATLPIEPTAAPAADQPQPPADRLPALLDELTSELQRRAAESSAPLRELTALAAMSLLQPDRAADDSSLAALPEQERELISQLRAFFTNLASQLGGTGDDDRIVAAVTKLHDAVKRTPPLRLANATLCWRVDGFGRFETFNRSAFLAHSEQPVILYIEVGDFASAPDADSQFVTKLSQQVVIYSAGDSLPVWQEDWQPAVDRTRHQRTDFFLTQVITLPKALSVGRYHLKVRVRDEQSKAEAETSIPFEMVADPKLAATAR